MEKQNLNLEDIKVGEKYKLELLCIHNKEKVIVFETPTGDHIPLRNSDHECICPANGIKNTEPVLKYYKNRKFRKGDRVKPLERNGRVPWAKDMTLTVVADEHSADVAVRDEETGEERLMCVLFLELVTPVEEIEPYRVETGGYNRFRIKKGNLEYSYFPFGEHCVLGMDEAKAAAEAECNRLNAEYRKEQNNG